jgi:lysophospholipase L1-like esterase
MSEWKTAWGYVRRPLAQRLPRMTVIDHRQTIMVQNNLSGDAIRILLSNAGNRTAIDYDGMELSVPGQPAKAITADGKTHIRLDACEERFSDEIAVDVKAGEPITISTRISGKVPIAETVAHYAPLLNTVQRDGGLKYPLIARRLFIETYGGDDCMWMYGFREIQVRTDAAVKTIAAFGDSITHMSRWTAPLTLRLYEKYPGAVTVKNCGISGNRLLRDSSQVLYVKGLFGPAGIRRFEEDVFGGGHVDAVFVMEGVNDLAHPVAMRKPGEMPTADDLIQGLKTLVDSAHRHKAKIFLCTILPVEGNKAWNSKTEGIRNRVNDWIRHNASADGFYDFAPILSVDGKDAKLDDRYHDGDYLHPNTEGGKKLADSIDIEALMAKIDG